MKNFTRRNCFSIRKGKYRKLFPFYQVGTGFRKVKQAGRAVLTQTSIPALCELTEQLFTKENDLWKAYKIYSELCAIRFRMYICQCILIGIVKAYNTQVDEMVKRLLRRGMIIPKKLDDKQNAGGGSSTIDIRSIIPCRMRLRDLELEERFTQFLEDHYKKISQLYGSDQVMEVEPTGQSANEMRQPLRDILQPAIGDEEMNAILPYENDRVDALQPAIGDVEMNIILPYENNREDVLQPDIEDLETSVIPPPENDRERSVSAQVLVSTDPAPDEVQESTERITPSVPVLVTAPVIPRKVDDINEIITYEKYQKIRKKELAADKARKKCIAEPRQPVGPFARYRPPVFGAEESSDDEPETFIVYAEVHEIPFSQRRSDIPSGYSGESLRDIQLPSTSTSAPPVLDIVQEQENRETSRAPMSPSVLPAVIPRIVITETDSTPNQQQVLGLHDTEPVSAVEQRAQDMEIVPEPTDLAPRDVEIPAAPEPQVQQAAEPERRQAVRRARDEIDDSSNSLQASSSAPPKKKRKWNPKYRYVYKMDTLKKRINRTKPRKPRKHFHLSAVDKLVLHDNMVGNFSDLYHLMYTHNNDQVGIREMLQFRKRRDGDYDMAYGGESVVDHCIPFANHFWMKSEDRKELFKMYQFEPAPARAPVRMWKREVTLDAEIDDASRDEEEIIDFIRDNLVDGSESETRQMFVDNLLERLSLYGRKSSAALEMQTIGDVVHTPKQTLVPKVSIPLPDPRESVMRRGAVVTQREQLATSDAPVIEQAVVEQAFPAATDDVTAYRQRATDQRIQDPITLQPDEPEGFRKEVPAMNVQSSTAPRVDLASFGRETETLANVEVLPVDAPGNVPPTEATAPVEQSVPTVTSSRQKKPKDDTQVPISEVISKELPGSVFIERGDPSLVIQCTLPDEVPDHSAWIAPVKQVQPLEEEEEDDEMEAVRSPRPRVSREDVEQKLRELSIGDNDDPVRFSTLCPPASTRRYAAAKTFSLLLHMHAKGLVKLENDPSRTSGDAVLIYSRTEQEHQ